MPRMDGLTFLEKLMRAHPMPVVMVSLSPNVAARPHGGPWNWGPPISSPNRNSMCKRGRCNWRKRSSIR
jgi:hypothetical protein